MLRSERWLNVLNPWTLRSLTPLALGDCACPLTVLEAVVALCPTARAHSDSLQTQCVDPVMGPESQVVARLRNGVLSVSPPLSGLLTLSVRGSRCGVSFLSMKQERAQMAHYIGISGLRTWGASCAAGCLEVLTCGSLAGVEDRESQCSTEGPLVVRCELYVSSSTTKLRSVF